MKKKLFRRAVLATLVLGVLGLFAWRVFDAKAARETTERPQTAAPVPVSTAVATPRAIADRVIFTGVIRPRNEVDVFTKVPGRVEEVRVQVGDRVKTGQVLAVIEHREISLHGDQAQAQLQAALAGLERANIGLETAAATYKRYEALRNENAVPQAEFERIESAHREARAGVMAAESQVATARAAVDLTAEAENNSRVTTPISGTVTRRLVSVGAQAAPGAPLFQVQDIAALKLESAVVASDFARLRAGQDVRVTVIDLPGNVFLGKLATLSPSLDPQTRRAAVEITISNPEGRLLPNMFGQAVIEVGRTTATLAVPERALVSLPSGPVIYVVRNGKAVEIQPRLGGIEDGFVAVESGLGQGENVVIAGQTTLRNGVAVRMIVEGAGKVVVP
jgi:RND family efflux transporter MFP subunit